MDWEASLALTDRTLADVFDNDTIHVRPRKAGLGVNDRTVDDTARVPFDFRGSIELSPPSIGNVALVSDPSSTRSAARFEAVVTALDDGWAYVPAKPDILQVSGKSYEIADISRDSLVNLA